MSRFDILRSVSELNIGTFVYPRPFKAFDNAKECLDKTFVKSIGDLTVNCSNVSFGLVVAMSACTGLFDPFNQKLMSVYEAKDDFSQEQMFIPSEKRASRISKAWLFVYGMYWLRCDFRYYRSVRSLYYG
ncbi:hypothetical protein AcW1_001940 [Taiwanofungus camphoratus]|nr:hypothetical protein AcW1_001940 [Antrodia cinnamomea]